VVENVSDDGSVEMPKRLQTEYPGLCLLLMEHNRGATVGRNAGFGAVVNRYLVCPDVEPFLAAIFGARLLVSHLWSALQASGISIVSRLLYAALRGMRSGRKAQRSVSAETLAFYSAPDLRPELGNVPLRVKLGRKFGRCVTQ